MISEKRVYPLYAACRTDMSLKKFMPVFIGIVGRDHLSLHHDLSLLLASGLLICLRNSF